MKVQRRDLYGAVAMIAGEYPDAFHSIEDVYIAAVSTASSNPSSRRFNPRGYEDKLVCRYELNMHIPPQTPDIQALVATSQDDRERTLNRRASDAQRQRNRTARKAEAAGRKVRSYRKRK